MFHTFRRSHSVRFLIITVALACLASWATFVTHSHSENAKRNLSRKASASKDVGAEPLRAAKPDDATRARVSEAYGKLPLSFEANRGQTDKRVKFLSRGTGYSLFLTSDEAVMTLARQKDGDKKQKGKLLVTDQRPPLITDVLRMKLVKANPKAEISGIERSAKVTNYFIGSDPRKWRTNVPNYAKVQYRRVYPGVDLIYYGNQRQLEYDFIVAPGADPKAIGMAFSGTVAPKIDDLGNLRLSSAGGEVVLQKPIVYQEIEGQRKAVDSRYVLDEANVVRFALGAYDRDHALIIDPVLVYSSFLGGSGDDGVYEVAVDGSENAFATGYTSSANFPTTVGAYDVTYNGGASDAFVTKLNSTGTAALFSTYFGGSERDLGDGIAVDASGNVYVGGLANSTDFPTTPGAYDTVCGSCGGGGAPGDAFVAKFNGTGALLAATLYGLNDYEQAYSLALDSAGNVYIGGGWSKAFSYSLPTVNGFQSAPLSYYDSFLAKFSPNLSTLLYATVVGGNNDDYAVTGIASSSPGVVSVTGVTRSINFPTTTGAFDSVCGTSPTQHVGIFDAFVMTINTNLSGAASLVYSTCLGGSGDEGGSGIALDGAANIWVTGGTSSVDFPTTTGAYDTTYNGLGDAFVTKLNPSASGAAQLAYSTFIGGSAGDGGAKVGLDASGNVYVAGSTSSTNFPTVNPLQGYGGAQDAFITELNPTTNLLVYSTYLGSCANESGYALALDPAGNAYVGGVTSSASFPVTVGAFQTVYGGSGDGFVMKIGPGAMVPYDPCPAVSPTPIPTPTPTPNLCANVTCTASDQCHVAGTCNPATGTCSNPNAADGTACSDGIACTQSDTCQVGTCTGGPAPNCDDGNPCTIDSCDPGGGCQNTPGNAGTVCRPGAGACDVAESCTGTNAACPADARAAAGTECRGSAGACDVAESCDGANNNCPADNFQAATTVCRASAGACDVAESCTGTNAACPADARAAAGTECRGSAGACDVAESCDGTNNNCPADAAAADGTACSDNDACTQSDTCQAGACTGSNPVVCAASDQCHTAGACDPSTGVCSNPAAADGTGCSDNNACTQSDTCQAGACVGSNPVTCTASDQCHVAGTCDPSTGVCTNPTAADGTACSDGNACTQTDTCQAGACVGTNPVTCTASDQCHAAGTCDPSTGVCSNPAKPDGTACSDGNACTQSDTCQAGACTGSNPVTCTGSDQCHVAGTCDPSTGVCTNPTAADGTACNDGNVCTTPDSCQNGTCGGAPVCTNPVQTGFVIGDGNAVVGNHVTFWGAQWAKDNSLSGGSAPSSFIGYANSATPNPPACGGSWKSDPGNSSGPPATVPQYIIVIVSSSITKSGSVISGNVPEMVVVRTDPGYDSNPGHAGTGTVVAVICQATTAELILPSRQSEFWFDLYWAIPNGIGSVLGL